MSYEAVTPFDSIESAHNYLSLLLEAAHEARDAVAIDLPPAGDSRYERRTAVLQLVSYSLEKLEKHVKTLRKSWRIVGRAKGGPGTVTWSGKLSTRIGG